MPVPCSRIPLLLLLLALAGCAAGSRGGSSGGSGEPALAGRAVEELEPHVRHVAEADHDLLWRAARDYMQKAFPVDSTDEEARVVESALLEWEENRMLHRTRVTVQVRPDPTDDRHAQVGIVAQLIEPRYDFEHAVSGRPAWNGWVLLGTNEKVAEVVGDQILRRYFLLRHGKDPDTTPQKDPFRTFERSSG